MQKRQTYTSNLALGADLRPLPRQCPWHERQQDTLVALAESTKERQLVTYNPSQQTSSAGICEIREHGVRNQWEDTGENVSTKRLRGDCGTGISMVRVGKVVERGQVDGKDTHGGATQGERRYNPWNGRVGGPSKPKQTGRHENGLDAGKVKPAFGGIGHLAQSHGQFLLVDAQNGGQKSTNGHRCELSVMDKT